MGTTFKKGLAPSGGQRKGFDHGSRSSFSVELQLDLGLANDRCYSGVPRFLPGTPSLTSVEISFEVGGRLSPSKIHSHGDGGNSPLCSGPARFGSTNVGRCLPCTRRSSGPQDRCPLFARRDDHVWKREPAPGITLAIDGCAGGVERLDSFRTNDGVYVHDNAEDSRETASLRVLG